MPFTDSIRPSDQRPLVFWAWNDRLSEERIRAEIAAFAVAGFGGVFMHPRPGLITEYLSAEWFSLCRFALQCCAEHGMSCSIYDENSFPSGFGGGHVVAENPLAVVHRLDLRLYPAGSPRPKQMLMALAEDSSGKPCMSENKEERWEILNQTSCYAIELNPAPLRRWFGGFAEVDLTRPGAGEDFIATTHERYRQHLGDAFGQDIPFLFTDEPQLGNVRGWLYSEAFEAACQQEHGFSLRERLADLFLDTETTAETRHAYHLTAQRLLEQNFFRPLHDWAARQKLELTGHVMEDHWPSPAHGPSTSGLLRWFQAPGLDLLAFQYRPAPPEEVIRWRHLALQVSSLGDQLGRVSRLCEACGGGGYGYGPADAKPMIDLLLAHGINRLVPHLSLSSLSGPRRYDWPQTFSPAAPWWPTLRAHNDYIQRTVEALDSARSHNRVLILEPTTVLWASYMPEAYGSLAAPAREQTRTVRDDFLRTLSYLLSAGVDVDVADEWLLGELAVAGAEGLAVGHRTYTAIVLPASWTAALASSLHWLSPMLNTNRVFPLGPKPQRWDGRLEDKLGNVGWKTASLNEDLIDALDALAPRRWRPCRVEPALSVLLRQRDDGTKLLFLANPHDRAAEVNHFFGTGQWRLLDASADVDLSCRDGQKGHFVGKVPPGRHALWETVPERCEVSNPSSCLSRRDEGRALPIEAKNWILQRSEPNIAVLTHGTLRQSDGREVRLIYPQIDQRFWQEQGQPGNPWSFAVQYRRTLLEHLHLCDRPFVVTSRFNVHPSAREGLRQGTALIVDRANHLQVLLNGNEIFFASEETYLDPLFFAAPVGRFLVDGENELVLRPLQLHPEICFNPPWLRGDFGVCGSLDQITLTPPEPLDWGGWESQEMPFFAGAIVLKAEFSLATPARRLRLALPEAAISSLQVSLDDASWESVCHRPWVWDVCRDLPTGSHHLELKVTGSLRNLLGPHFSSMIPHAWAWLAENAPRQPDPFGLPYAPEIRVWSL